MWRALRNISKGQVFDENFLMSIGTIGAFAIGDYTKAVAVMLFYQIGKLFQEFAVKRSKKSITALMDIRPDFANLKRNSDLIKVDPNTVSVGDIIVVKPGEKIPGAHRRIRPSQSRKRRHGAFRLYHRTAC